MRGESKEEEEEEEGEEEEQEGTRPHLGGHVEEVAQLRRRDAREALHVAQRLLEALPHRFRRAVGGQGLRRGTAATRVSR